MVLCSVYPIPMIGDRCRGGAGWFSLLCVSNAYDRWVELDGSLCSVCPMSIIGDRCRGGAGWFSLFCVSNAYER